MHFIAFVIFLIADGTRADCGTSPSRLEQKCLSYPSLSHFYNGYCYVLETTQQRTKAEVLADAAQQFENVCAHMNGYRAELPQIDGATEVELRSVGLINDKRHTIAGEKVFGSGSVDDGAKYSYLCKYADEYRCRNNYELSGVHCFGLKTNSADFVAADAACRALNETLAVVHDDSTAQFVAKLARRSGVTDPFVRIGLWWDKADKEWQNADSTTTDYFRWISKAGGFSSLVKNPEIYRTAVLYSQVNTKDGEGTFGYMDLVDSGLKAPYVCQHLAVHTYGNVVVPGSNLWTLEN